MTEEEVFPEQEAQTKVIITLEDALKFFKEKSLPGYELTFGGEASHKDMPCAVIIDKKSRDDTVVYHECRPTNFFREMEFIVNKLNHGSELPIYIYVKKLKFDGTSIKYDTAKEFTPLELIKLMQPEAANKFVEISDENEIIVEGISGPVDNKKLKRKYSLCYLMKFISRNKLDTTKPYKSSPDELGEMPSGLKGNWRDEHAHLYRPKRCDLCQSPDCKSLDCKTAGENNFERILEEAFGGNKYNLC